MSDYLTELVFYPYFALLVLITVVLDGRFVGLLFALTFYRQVRLKADGTRD